MDISYFFSYPSFYTIFSVKYHEHSFLKDGIRFLPVAEVRLALPDLLNFAASGSSRLDRLDDQAPIGENNNSDFSAVYQILFQLQRSLDQCCAVLQEDFQETWTILATISTGSIVACCSDLESLITTEFNQTWTILSEINQTVTTCCAALEQLIANDFSATWTILKEVTDDQNGTFTVLDTILNGLVPTCSATIILTQTTISSPGKYCLGASIDAGGSVAIVIDSDGVTLDLNGNSVSGSNAIIVANSRTDVCITNGVIKNTTSSGIIVDSLASNVCLKNLQILNCGFAGIIFQSQNTNCSASDIIITGPATREGIFALDPFQLTIKNVTIQDFSVNSVAYGIVIANSGENLIIEDVNILNLSSQLNNAYGISLAAVSNLAISNLNVSGIVSYAGIACGINAANTSQSLFNNITVFDIRSASSDAYGISSNSDTFVIQNSIVDFVISNSSTAWGMLIASSQSVISDVKVRKIIGGVNGFGIEFRDSSLCSLAEIIRGGSGTSSAIYLNNDVDCVVSRCIVRDSNNGVAVGGSGNIVENCQCIRCGITGIYLGFSGLVNACSAINSNNGIIDVLGTSTITNCYAWQNVTNNYVGVTNVYAVGSPVLAGYNLSA